MIIFSCINDKASLLYVSQTSRWSAELWRESTWSLGVCLRSSLADDGAVTSLPVDDGTELAAPSTSVTGVNDDIDATDSAAVALSLIHI